MIKTDSSVSIPVLQSAVHQSYHSKLSYRNVWMVKQKVIAKIYGNWEESYNRIPALLQALQECLPDTIHAFPPCIEAFKRCKPFVYVDGTYLYKKYKGVLLITVAQDGNNNILPIDFSLVEFETTETWTFFLSNLRQHVTPKPRILIISDRSRAICTAINAPHSGWHPPSEYHVYCIRNMASNFNLWFKLAEGKGYLVNVAYSPSKECCD
ncbi:hypothetical protein Ahy_A09g041605 [Arachis hypogaea]|uniref:MULE transposase domain-containing protein n=1 Tax=Arachis hypogaea TaxID=3818 RepID=A0A445BD91_ARAHY|nr:hypothetical protein Ahy_A09g041605 [Arachis hypogaea]